MSSRSIALPTKRFSGNDHVFAQSQVMGDIAGFYRAFGVELSKDIHERLDHLSVEFEFMHFWPAKESYSLLSRWSGQDPEIVLERRKSLSRIISAGGSRCLCRMLVKKAASGLYKHVADVMAEWMDFEAAF